VACLGDKCDNDDITMALLESCIDRLIQFNTLDVSILFRAIAMLGITDCKIIQEVSCKVLTQVKDLNHRLCSTYLWASATLGEDVVGTRFTSAIIDSCLNNMKDINEQDVAKCLWSVAVLDHSRYADLSSMLSQIVLSRFALITNIDEAHMCLQAHCSGITLSNESILHFRAITQKRQQPLLITHCQEEVAETLKRLGYSP
jgi:hypothetical protein